MSPLGSKENNMKKLRMTLILGLLSLTCLSQVPVASPCNDSLYTSLKSKAIGQMTDREFAYFNQKEKDCAEFRKALMQEEVKVETLNVAKKTMDTYWIILFVGVAASLIPWLLL
jgi:hypothetical protein